MCEGRSVDSNYNRAAQREFHTDFGPFIFLRGDEEVWGIG